MYRDTRRKRFTFFVVVLIVLNLLDIYFDQFDPFNNFEYIIYENMLYIIPLFIVLFCAVNRYASCAKMIIIYSGMNLLMCFLALIFSGYIDLFAWFVHIFMVISGVLYLKDKEGYEEQIANTKNKFLAVFIISFLLYPTFVGYNSFQNSMEVYSMSDSEIIDTFKKEALQVQNSYNRYFRTYNVEPFHEVARENKLDFNELDILELDIFKNNGYWTAENHKVKYVIDPTSTLYSTDLKEYLDELYKTKIK